MGGQHRTEQDRTGIRHSSACGRPGPYLLHTKVRAGPRGVVVHVRERPAHGANDGHNSRGEATSNDQVCDQGAGSGFRRAQGSGYRAQGSGLRAQGPGLRTQEGSRLRVQGSGGLMAHEGSGIRVQVQTIRCWPLPPPPPLTRGAPGDVC